MERYSENDVRRLSSSLMLSFSIWMVLFILLAVLPMKNKKISSLQYRDIKISLQVENTKTPLEKIEEPIKESVVDTPKPSPSKPQEVTSTSSSVRSSTTKSSAAEAKPATEQKTSGLGIPNFSIPVESSSRANNQAEYLDFSSQTESSRKEIERSMTSGSYISEFEGSAGVVKSEKTYGAVAKTVEDSSTTTKTSGNTSEALANITRASALGPLYEDSIEIDSSEIRASSGGKSDGKSPSHTQANLDFEGSPRKLLSPSSASVNLPESLSKSVDSDKTVLIEFVVLSDGTVPIGLIKFIPEAILPLEVRDYLRREFASWRFEKHKGEGLARFEYSIKTE